MALRVIGALLSAGAMLASGSAASQTTKPEPRVSLPLQQQAWTGDYRAMVERRVIRILVPRSRSLFFIDAGQERGLTAELARDFERFVNERERSHRRPVTVFLVPTSRDRLLAGVRDGSGDIAAGNLTITPERLDVVDFREGGVTDAVVEVVVTGPRSPKLAAIDDLAGKTVHVRRSSSYFGSLSALNDRFASNGRPPIRLAEVPDALEDEDLLDMLNTGLLDLLVVDDWKAKLWARALPRIVVREDLPVSGSNRIGWAIRKQSPELAAVIDAFFRDRVRGKRLAEQRMASYMRRARQLRDPTNAAAWRRFERTYALFEKYGQRYRFDALLLTAQGFQESRLRQEARSPAGAIGIMQLLPGTGSWMNVGDITVAEPNIHAGTKFMDMILKKQLAGEGIEGVDRTLFALAAYNAGPARIGQMRRLASARGLDPDAWFDNVEIVTAERIGAETTGYVRNIFKYYVSYKLQMQRDAERRNALD